MQAHGKVLAPRPCIGIVRQLTGLLAMTGDDALRMMQLDALRAFAVLAVVTEHYGGRTLNSLIPISAGYIGVGLFFVLSGFLITSLLLTTFEAYGNQRGTALRNFYARRMLRLAPPFYLVLFALVIIGLEPIASSWPWHAAYLTNVWVAMGNPSNVFWSLAVEEQFYLLWPVLLLAAGRGGALKLAVAIILAGVAFRIGWVLAGFNTRAAIYLLFANFILLGIGSLVGVISHRDGKPFQFGWFTPRVERLFGAAALVCFALAVVAWLFYGTQGLLRFLTLDLLVGISFAWVIVKSAVGWRGVMGAVMTQPALLYLGKISYMVYLTHNFVPRVYEHYLGTLADWQLLALSVPTVLIICALSWRFVERPLLALKPRFPEAPEPKRAAGAAATAR
jgi:peptidoglycan/LPS O-acetylase OafA/YrhL